MPRTKKETKPKKEKAKTAKSAKKKPEKKKKEVVKEKKEKVLKKKAKYFEAVGRRKTSTARVRLFTRPLSKEDKGPSKEKKEGEEILVNEKPYKVYFPIFSLQKEIEAPLEKLNLLGKFVLSIFVKGGGISSQAEACRHGISRALVLLNPYFKRRLRKVGFLTRDSRQRERKKFGLKRARKAPQWSKR